MRKQLVCAVAAVAGLALIAVASALAKPETFQVGNLFLTDSGGITPSALPRHEQAPIAAHLKGRIGTTDGTHPPAIKSVVADFDKTVQVHAKGLPVCRKGKLQARTTAAAKAACPDAIIGTGKAEVEVEFDESKPFSASGPIVVFNGGVKGGVTTLLIHAYVAVPAPTAVVATVELTHIHRGHYGLHADARIPAIAGGSGSVTGYEMTINRRFTYRGKKQSYLTASCPTGSYYAEAKVEFSDATALHVTHALPCTPVG